MKLKKHIADYFTFNRSERRGVLVLLGILLVLVLVTAMLPAIRQSKTTDYSQFEAGIDSFMNDAEVLPPSWEKEKPQAVTDFYNIDRSATESRLKPFPFDPNRMTPASWADLGLNPGQIRSIEKYKARGGKFKDKKDFKKLYCISETEYLVLEPYIITGSQPDAPARTAPVQKNSSPPITVDINSASAEELMGIKGIGKYFADKILLYRQKLGGYYTAGQLLEIPRMDSLRYNQILPFIRINEKAIRKINVNTATFDELKNHPYIGYNIALSLTNMRQLHGAFARVEDIKKSALITDKNYQKIARYLRTE